MLKYIILSLIMVILALGISWGGMSVTKDTIGFLSDNSTFSNFSNQISPTEMNNFLNFLGVSNLRSSTLILPGANNQNLIYPFNYSNNSVIRNAFATLGQSQIGNAWQIKIDQNNNYILQFSAIVTNFDFQSPLLTGGNKVSSVSWDPNISGNISYGIAYNGTVYKIYKDGTTIVGQQLFPQNESGGISSNIGDFNNDGKPDFFVIRTNENNQQASKVNSAYVLSQGNSENQFNKINLDISNWAQGQNKVDVKWTSGAVTANYQKWDPNQNKYVIDKFDYNGDGKQDVLIASADGAVYVIPNISTGNNISFGNPQKLVTTNVKTGEDGSYTGAQVLSAGDINKDGKPDIVVGSTDSSKLYVFYGKTDNQGKIYFGNQTNTNQPSVPDIKLYDTSVNGSDKIVVRNSSTVESAEYRGPNTQRDSSGNNPPNPEFTGGLTNIILADFNKDGELDIISATDGWQFKPNKYQIGAQPSQNFDLTIKHTNQNIITNSQGGRVYFFVKNPTSNKYKTYFLGQYAIIGSGPDADFDNATINNFSGGIDFIATDGNDSQQLFTFLQTGSGFNNADKFVIESKDLIRKGGISQDSFNFNNNSNYIKTVSLKIAGDLKGIPTTVRIANRIENGNPLYVNINIPSNLLTFFDRSSPLTITVDFYPSSSPNVMYKIGNGGWVATNVSKMRGSSIVYTLEFDTSNPSFKTTVTTLTGQNITGLNKSVEITNIEVSYEAFPQSLKIKNWKEVR